MCGIFALFSSKYIKTNKRIRAYATRMIENIKHRGPDGTGIIQTEHGCIAHKRLAIIDLSSKSDQPLVNTENNLFLSINGEIFNYKNIKLELKHKYHMSEHGEHYVEYIYKTDSDCEPILALYEYYSKFYNKHVNFNDFYDKNHTGKYINEYNLDNVVLTHDMIVKLLEHLDGQFSFVLHCTITNMVLVARDPYSITQLYWGIDINGNIQIASELKALESCISVEILEGGSYLYFSALNPIIKPVRYFAETKAGSWLDASKKEELQYYYDPQPLLNDIEQQNLMCNIRNTLENEVEKRLMCDMPNGFAVCLSGGLDSSLLASITMRYMKAHPEKYGLNPELHTFSIGIKDESNDLIHAREVAKFIGSIHHELHFTPEEAIRELNDTIYHAETYDITTIRCSILHRIMCKKIKEFGFKMVLSGEGADEINGSYLYFHQAPNDEEHQLECKKRLLELGYFDCLRVDKSSMSASCETRVPYLAYDFVKLLINVHKDIKTQKGIEKYIVRKAFDLKDENGMPLYLPESVLWRVKIQFSAGIGINHINELKKYTDVMVNTHQKYAYENRHIIYPFNTPFTTEAFYYRMVFEQYFQNRSHLVKLWVPNSSWTGITNMDPSGVSGALLYDADELHKNH